MKKSIFIKYFVVLIFLLFHFNGAAQLKIDKDDVKEYGFSYEKLNELDSVMHSFVDNKDFSNSCDLVIIF